MNIEFYNNKAFIRIDNKLDEPGVKLFKMDFDFLEKDTKIKEVILDFRKITQVSSSGLGKLLYLYRYTKNNKVKITFTNVNSALKNLFQSVKMDILFNIEF